MNQLWLPGIEEELVARVELEEGVRAALIGLMARAILAVHNQGKEVRSEPVEEPEDPA
jgi:hypothetical protein